MCMHVHTYTTKQRSAAGVMIILKNKSRIKSRDERINWATWVKKKKDLMSAFGGCNENRNGRQNSKLNLDTLLKIRVVGNASLNWSLS